MGPTVNYDNREDENYSYCSASSLPTEGLASILSTFAVIGEAIVPARNRSHGTSLVFGVRVAILLIAFALYRKRKL